MKTVRETADRLRLTVGILQDVPGPKLRVGSLSEGTLDLKRGDRVVLAYSKKESSKDVIPILHPGLTKDLKRGHLVYISDGLIRLTVLSVNRDSVRCRVLNGGTVRSGNGVNLPNSRLTLKAFTKEDERHLSFGLRQGVDFVGISFVQNARDIRRVRAFCHKRGASPFLIAKIERLQALKNLESIIDAADGVMIARGDLGVETPYAELPGIQKRIVWLSRQKGKPVIVATQVLESMIQNPRPTRAEATDIANAVLERADAIMLSGETATGKYPRESVRTLSEVIRATEKENPLQETEIPVNGIHVSDIIAHEACHIADRIGAKVIVVPGQSGGTAARVSRFRPCVPIIPRVISEKLGRRLCVYWGVHTFKPKSLARFPSNRSTIRKELLREGIVRPGDYAVLVSENSAEPQDETSVVEVIRV